MKIIALVVLVAFICFVQSASVQKRQVVDVKTALLTRARELIARANADVIAAGTQHAQTVDTIKKDITDIQKLVVDLTAATDERKVLELETKLSTLEDQLAQLLILVEGSTTTNRTGEETKTALLTRARALLARADKDILAAGTQNTQTVNQIKKDVSDIEKLVVDLTVATDDRKVLELEQKLSTLEDQLAQLLSLVEGSPTTNTTGAETKTMLLTRARELLARADADILAAGTNHATIVNQIKADVTEIERLVVDLTAATDERKVLDLETKLSSLENQLSQLLLLLEPIKTIL